MHVLLVPLGSTGDVYPFVALGTELVRRGHRVSLFASGSHRALAEAAGFEFDAYASQKDELALIGEPDLWHPLRSVRLLARRAVLPAVPLVHRLIARQYRPGRTAVVAGSLALGARIAGETLDLPLTTVHLQPVVFRSMSAPAVYPGSPWIGSLPHVWRPAVFRLMDVMLDHTFAPSLNAFRSEFGLAPVNRVMNRWWHAPESTLAFFPEWFAPPQPDWPRQVRCCGFPLYDGADLEVSDFDLRAYLAAGEPPIVFTSGTQMAAGMAFYKASAEACARLGRRALFVTRFPEQLPKPLPRLVRHVDYVPFSKLLPGAAALVHHGGIGTASQALKAGVPQLVVPHAFDQFDNAARLQRLGVSLTLPAARCRAASVEAALRKLLAMPELGRNCVARAQELADTNALVRAADALEEYWRQRPGNPHG
ncbi:MAG: glycosyltransferase [Steroidobacteraceae bacterium]